MTVGAERCGYLTAIDLDALCEWTTERRGQLALPATGTRFVRTGEPVALLSRAEDANDVRDALRISRMRREGAGAPFHAALLVEIAVRALSPALNDIYTALVCVDRLRDGLAPGFASGRLDGRFGAGGAVRAEGLSARGLLAEPLAILRHAAAPLPAMSLRLADALARLAQGAGDDGDAAWLRARAREVLGQALEHASGGADRVALEAALADPPDG